MVLQQKRIHLAAWLSGELNILPSATFWIPCGDSKRWLETINIFGSLSHPGSSKVLTGKKGWGVFYYSPSGVRLVAVKEWIPLGATLSACSTSCPPLRKIRNLSSFVVRHFSVRADTTRAELPVYMLLQLDLGKQPHLASSGRAWQLLRKQLFPECVKSRKGRQDRRLSLMAGACMAILSEPPPSFSSSVSDTMLPF